MGIVEELHNPKKLTIRPIFHLDPTYFVAKYEGRNPQYDNSNQQHYIGVVGEHK